MGAVDAFCAARSDLAQDMSPPVAAIMALTAVIQESKAGTVMGLGDELRAAADELGAYTRENAGTESSIPVQSACDTMIKFVIRSSSELLAENSFDQVKSLLIQRSNRFADRLVSSRDRLASFGHKFIGDGKTVLVHGYSRAVVSVLRLAASKGRNFEVVVTEGRPDCSGYKLAQKLTECNIPAKIIMDTAIGFVMERVDMVLVGAEGLLESGGISNRVGTFPLALVAKAHKTPFYVAAESFKFTRVFPLSQKELGDMDVRSAAVKNRDLPLPDVPGVEAVRAAAAATDGPAQTLTVQNTLSDYTPPECITLLFTDLGVLTPAAVSDELIRMYQ
mmetsp:Transcript_12280/g.31289  ORF Transcript_12280/g.31289 Transcript_12280/m.31289 type:complete len:334 (+) Transcript_12280:78-1079(+)